MSERKGSVPRVASEKAPATGNVQTRITQDTTRITPGRNHYLNDGDKDMVGDADRDEGYYVPDSDKDHFLDQVPRDYQAHENSRYHDADDHGTVVFGRAANMVQRRVITAVVKRYYTAAARGDGVLACSQLTRGLADAVPVDYGQYYLGSGKTCSGILSLLFKHNRKQLAAPIAVTGVRIAAANQAYALLGSPAVPASYIIVRNEDGAWRIAQLLGSENPLP